jgi:ABC-type bacteriocin/lantibiotic exporter with double-glycine peptidase domain
MFMIGLLSTPLQAAEIVGVPFILQGPGTCGPAALASVMAYYGEPIDLKTISTDTYTPEVKGAIFADLENFARERGFCTEFKQGDPGTIKEAIERRRPVIVLVDLGFWVISRPHYLVVTGYDEHGFTAHCGYRAAEHFSYRRFERLWKHKGSTYLIIWPSSVLPQG